MALAATVVGAQSNQSLTIGGVTFDWAAPAPPLTPAQKAFFQSYKTAINAHDERALLALGPARSGCKYDGHQILFRDFRFPIPENAKVRFFSATKDFAKDFGFGDVAYLPLAPTATFAVSFSSATKNHVSSTDIYRPFYQSGDTITLIPYCLTEKGEHLIEQKEQSGK
jgi:hypothetical protein